MKIFKLGWIPVVAAVLGVALTISLGNWQMRRAVQKEVLQQALNQAQQAAPVMPENWQQTEALVHQHLRVRGQWQPAAVVYLDNRPYQGRAGLYVLMPLKLEPGGAILMVNRGWLSRDAQERTRIAPYVTPTGSVELQGVALVEEPRLFELGPTDGQLGTIWQNFDAAHFRQLSGLTPLLLVLRQDADDQQDGLIRDWPDQGAAMQAQIDRHHGYAAQWYGLAALIVFLTLFYGYRNARKPKPS